jgi:hypothetical protein
VNEIYAKNENFAINAIIHAMGSSLIFSSENF